MIKPKDAVLSIIYKTYMFSRLYHPAFNVTYLELTNNCNLKCKMCHYQDMREKTDYMSTLFFEIFASQLSEIRLDAYPNIFCVFGGAAK